jgi:hypothetical protein
MFAEVESILVIAVLLFDVESALVAEVLLLEANVRFGEIVELEVE